MTRKRVVDPDAARAQWMAGDSVMDIARAAGVSRNALYQYAVRYKWPRREDIEAAVRAPVVLRCYPCVRCGAPDATVRKNARCPGCSLEHRRERTRERNREARNPLGVRRWKGIPVPAPAVPKPERVDDDIACYRREKAKREGREDARIADARRLFLLLEEGMKPKRGRPRQDFRGEAAA